MARDQLTALPSLRLPSAGDARFAVRHMKEPPAQPDRNPWPRYLRVLAVLHVLSIPLGFVGFLALCLAAGVMFWQRGAWDLRVISAGIAALACPVFGASYRRWFENFGRKRWPDGKFK